MKRRSARIIKALAILLVMLASLYAVAWLLAARSLRQAYAELEADGRPMTMKEIELDPVPPSQNAAPLYQAALLLLQSEPFGDVSLQDHLATNTWVAPDDPRSSEAIESELREALQQEVCAEALKWIEKGSARSDYRFIGKNYNPTASPFNIGQHNDSFRLGGMIALGRLLNARARIQMADGDRDGAWSTAYTSFQFADSFTKIPVLIGQILRLTLASSASENARNLCATSSPDPKQLDELQALLRSFDNPAPFVHTFDVQRIILDCLLFHTPSADSEKLASPFDLRENGIPRHIYLKPIRMADYAFYLRTRHRLAQAYERMDSRNALQADEIQPQPPFFYPLSNNTLMRINYLPKMRQHFANLRITSAGLAALKFHRKHGAFPESLAELGDLNLTDPFTGEELAYRVEPDGFVLSSPGPKAGPEDDMVWQYQIPANSPVPTDR